MPGKRASLFEPSIVADSEGNLNYVQLTSSFNTSPINREFYPAQIDLLDLLFEMGTSQLINDGQRIVQHLLCLHPSYTGFGNSVSGADAEGGIETSDALAIVPHMTFDRVEPYFSTSNDQFYFGEVRQQSIRGLGGRLQSMIGLRIIVHHPKSKAWVMVTPILFVSLTTVANFLASNFEDIGAWSMVQALLSVSVYH